MTVNQLHKLLARLIAQGHGRTRVSIDKATFTDPRENDGPMILPVCELEAKWVPDAADDGGIAINKDGTERGRQTCVLGGASYERRARPTDAKP